MTYARRIDTTHIPIKKTLEAAGFYVVDCSRLGGGFPDLIATKHLRAFYVECKSVKATRRNKGDGLNKTQIEFRLKWKGPKIIASESPEDALQQINRQIMEV